MSPAARRAPRAARVASAAPRTAIRVAIDRIAIEGRSRREHVRAADEFARALASLAEGAPGFDWSAVTAVPRLDGGAVSRHATPEEIGRRLAAALFQRLSR